MSDEPRLDQMEVLHEPAVAAPNDFDATVSAEVAARIDAVPVQRHSSPAVIAAIVWLSVLFILSLLAPILPIEAYDDIVDKSKIGPDFRWPEPLGTDEIGRSMLSRVLVGARVSLLVGFCSVAIAMVVGGLIGMVAGYFQRKVDAVISVGVDTLLAFPPLVLLLALSAVLSRTLPNLIVILALLITPTFARLARANTMAFVQRDVVTAARGLGASHVRILRREVLPNIVLPVISYAFIVVAVVIVAEGSLSFLGLGIQPPTPSWGGMIEAGRDKLQSEPYLVFVPAVFLFLTVLACNVLGDWMRARFGARRS